MENVFTLLSDTLFLTIVSSLLRMLDCTCAPPPAVTSHHGRRPRY